MIICQEQFRAELLMLLHHVVTSALLCKVISEKARNKPEVTLLFPFVASEFRSMKVLECFFCFRRFMPFLFPCVRLGQRGKSFGFTAQWLLSQWLLAAGTLIHSAQRVTVVKHLRNNTSSLRAHTRAHTKCTVGMASAKTSSHRFNFFFFFALLRTACTKQSRPKTDSVDRIASQ